MITSKYFEGSEILESKPKKISISAFFPCYNDGGTIASMVLNTLITLEDITSDFEVIVIDDGSADASRAILRRLERDYPAVKVIYHPENYGYGGALRSGFSTASKEFIFYTDGDAQYDVRELKKLVAALNGDIDVVQGYKIKRHDPFHRVIIGMIYQYTIKAIFQLSIRDVDCDFRLIRKKVFDKIRLEKDSGVICLEMVKKIQDAGFRFVEVPVNHFFRAYGKSQFFDFRRVFRVGIEVLKLWKELVVTPKLIGSRRKD